LDRNDRLEDIEMPLFSALLGGERIGGYRRIALGGKGKIGQSFAPKKR
jgi:hypothetical protein